MSDRDLGSLVGTSLFVFGHPNHELAALGMVQRLRPTIVFLTDGGGPARIEQTRAGLGAIGLLERASFLGYDEEQFYSALLAGDLPFFQAIAVALRAVVGSLAPAFVFADAVELYNPVHDLTLPIARSALGGGGDIRYFEVPLIYEDDLGGHVVQRVPPSLAAESWRLALTPGELAAKKHARDSIYTRLRRQLEPTISGVPDEHLAREEAMEVSVGSRPRDPAQALRYERRGETLQREGRVQTVIRHHEHYAPIAAALTAGQ